MNTKICPACSAVCGRTLQVCDCGHKFTSANTAWREKARAGVPVKRGRPAKYDIDAPEPETQLLALAEPKLRVPDAARFVCQRLPNGGLQLSWPDFQVTFTLTAAERMILRSVA